MIHEHIYLSVLGTRLYVSIGTGEVLVYKVCFLKDPGQLIGIVILYITIHRIAAYNNILPPTYKKPIIFNK